MMESWRKILTHPSKGVEKTYEVRIKVVFAMMICRLLPMVLKLEDGITAPATIVDLGFDDHNGVHEVEITIHEGRNRQVRRMFEHFGYRIHNLKRIAYAGLTLGGVKRGASRQLTIREVKALKALGQIRHEANRSHWRWCGRSNGSCYSWL